MTDAPLVSIIVPILNRSDLFVQTVDSLLAQTETRWEAIVVDDGSHADHAIRIREQCARDGRIRLQARQSPTPGAPACRNQGIREARGEYLVFLDSDDCLAADSLSERVRCMQLNAGLDFGVFVCMVFRDEPGDSDLLHNADTGEDDLLRFLKLDIPWQTTSPTWRRDAVERLGSWDESLPSWQDWDWHVRALASGLRYARFGGGVCYWRHARGDTIGRSQGEPGQIARQAEMLVRTAGTLGGNGLLTLPRREALVGLFLWLGIVQRHNRLMSEALEVWRKAMEARLVTRLEYGAGALYLVLFHVPLCGKAWRAVLKWCWPPERFFRRSSTAWVVPESQGGLEKRARCPQ